MHRSLGAETDPADRCSAGKVFPFRPVVPVNGEACGAEHADGVGDGILRNVEDDLDATLALLKRLTSHETIMKPTTARPTTVFAAQERFCRSGVGIEIGVCEHPMCPGLERHNAALETCDGSVELG